MRAGAEERDSTSGLNMVASPSRAICKKRQNQTGGVEAAMNAELDYELTLDQWETLKALRVPAPERTSVNGQILKQLIALGLAAMREGTPKITDWGRKVLVRGSSRLWDVAA
jgi:hypothetical protein